MYKISSVKAREILDSRGNPTVEAEIYLEGNHFGRSSVPSGASTGSHEAVELRDKDKRYNGKGVLKAVDNIIKIISPKIIGKSFDQESFDNTLIALDRTENKSNLGANSILALSIAFSKAAASVERTTLYNYFNKIAALNNKLVLPVPMVNILNGGKHALNSTDLQEFMIMPLGAPNFREVARYSSEVFHALGKILAAKGLNTSVGDEGGYAPSLPSNEAAIKIIIEAIKKAGYMPGKDIFLVLDCAATELYKNGKYILSREKKKFSSSEMISLYKKWCEKYPIVSIEDGLAEDDWEGYTQFTKSLGSRIQIVGDDLFVTNIKRLQRGIKERAANSILIKPNQIGTISETIAAVRMASKAGLTSVISHRSGETDDTTIADLAVGLGVGQIKTGSVCRGERIAKYNQLLRIEEELGSKALFAGRSALKQLH